MHYTKADARKFVWRAGVGIVGVWTLLLLLVADMVPWWVVALTLTIPLTHWMTGIHEAFHICAPKDLPVWFRCYLLPFSPLQLGHDEFHWAHRGHHRETATEQDPDWFHIGGGHLKSFFGALVFIEGNAVVYLHRQGWHHLLAWPFLLRAALFIGPLTLFGWDFVLFWVILRLTHTVSIWVFFHHLHYRNGEYGTFPLTLPKGLHYTLALLYGKDAVDATMYHNLHHENPRIAVWNLAVLSDKRDTFRDNTPKPLHETEVS